MKTTMKTTVKIMAAMAVMMGFAFNAMGQATNTANSTFSGKAVVAAAVSVTKGADLDFKNVTPGVNKTIAAKKDAASRVTAGTATGGEAQGYFNITKGADTSMRLTFTLPGTLESGTNTLTIDTYKYSIFATSATDDADIANGGTVDITSADFSNAYQASSFECHIGATVKPTASQVAGSYSGTITLSATYN